MGAGLELSIPEIFKGDVDNLFVQVGADMKYFWMT